MTDDLDRITGLCKQAAEKTFSNTKQIHVRKLERLTKKEKSINLSPKGLEKWIVNRTGRTLTTQQEEVLTMGLNYVPTPSKIPVRDIAAAVETAASELSSDGASDLRLRVCGILCKAKPSTDNLTKKQRRALKELRKMVILPADQGDATVLMENEKYMYTTKLKNILATPTYMYKELKRNPTAAQEVKIGRILRGLVRMEEISDTLYYNKLRPGSGCQPPRIYMYGLPKIHKPEIPLRPNISCINSPTYQLAKHIAQLISPLTGQTDSHVKNSRHFAEIKAGEKLEPDELLVSFDVVSLFTNAPVEEAIDVTRRLLQEDETLGEKTVLSVDKIAELLKLCLKSTYMYFSFEGRFYEQREGTAMGSPVSAVIANIYMEYFEHRALESAPQRPRLWKRYVDDTFCIVNKGSVDELLDHHNSVRPPIQFTIEQEKEGVLPFLDKSTGRKMAAWTSLSTGNQHIRIRPLSPFQLTPSTACEAKTGQVPFQ